MNGSNGGVGASGRRSGRRSSEPLQHISVGSAPSVPQEDEVLDETAADVEPEAEAEQEPDAEARASTKATAASTPRRVRMRVTARRSGLDRIRPRNGNGGVPASAAVRAPSAPAHMEELETADRDPLGRAALYSSGSQDQSHPLGTFLVECSACNRETPVTAGDLLRLGIPSIHLLFLRRYPSWMRCPACGRRTWVRVRWHL
jgi:hypothetical protein